MMSLQARIRRQISGLFTNRGIKFFHDLVHLVIGQMAGKIAGIACFAYLARTVDPAAYGTLEYVIGLAALAAVLVDFGFGPIGVREAGAGPESRRAVAEHIPAIRVLIALLAAPLLILVVLATTDAPLSLELALLFAASLLLHPFKQEWLLQSMELMNRIALAQALRMILFAILVFLFVKETSQILRVGLIEIGTLGLWFGYYLLVQHRAGLPIRLSFPRAELTRLTRAAAPLGAGAMVWAFNQYIPLILVTVMMGTEETAWFAAAHRLLVSLLAISYLYHFNLYPALTRRMAQSVEAFARLSHASFRIVAWGLIGPCALLGLVASDVMRLVYGAPFAVSGPVLAAAIWCLPVTLFSGHSRWALITAHRQGEVLRAQTAGAVVTLLLAPPFIWAFGAVGAALTMTAGCLAIWALAHRYASRSVVAMPGLETLWRPALATALAIGLFWLARPFGPWTAVGLSGLLYGAAGIMLDRRLLPDLRHLAYAKIDSQRAADVHT